MKVDPVCIIKNINKKNGNKPVLGFIIDPSEVLIAPTHLDNLTLDLYIFLFKDDINGQLC